MLKPGGRLLFILRLRDNGLTRLIDYVGIPLVYGLRNILEWRNRSDVRYRFKLTGYRRRPREIAALANREGFKLRSMHHAGHAMELTRIHVDHFPWLFALAQKVDRHLHWANNAVLMEFVQ
jgi:hypothetical protein